jgi:hypothetical protein
MHTYIQGNIAVITTAASEAKKKLEKASRDVVSAQRTLLDAQAALGRHFSYIDICVYMFVCVCM